jgi:hypothetical protein
MITRFKISAVIGLIVWSHAFGGIGEAYAEEVSAENLNLETTFIKTENTALFLSTNPIAGFTQTTVDCPGRGGCTIRVELSTQFSGIQVPNVAAVALLIDSSQADVQPFAVVGLDSTSTGGGSNARTFSWMKTGLTRGQHTIDVTFFTTGGSASVPGRTLTIQVYR